MNALLAECDLPKDVLIVGKPGTKEGPCKNVKCQEPRCQALRAIAGATCVICKNEIGFDRPYRPDFLGNRMHHTCAVSLHQDAVARNYLKKEARLVA